MIQDISIFPMPQHYSLSESKIRTIYQPPSILLQITEGSINNTCKKLSPCDEEGIDGDQSTSQVGWRNLSDVHGHCHGSKACREEPKKTWDIRASTLTHAGIKHTHTLIQAFILLWTQVITCLRFCLWLTWGYCHK